MANWLEHGSIQSNDASVCLLYTNQDYTTQVYLYRVYQFACSNVRGAEASVHASDERFFNRMNACLPECYTPSYEWDGVSVCGCN